MRDRPLPREPAPQNDDPGGEKRVILLLSSGRSRTSPAKVKKIHPAHGDRSPHEQIKETQPKIEHES